MHQNSQKKIRISKASRPYFNRNTVLNLLFNDIRSYKPLSKEKTNQLFELYNNGTEKEREYAFDKICRHNMRMVISIARDYCTTSDNLNDLIQEGNIGLMKAIELFDMDNGAPFHGYALYWIRRYINLFKTNITPIVQQTNRSKTSSIITTITSELIQKLERIPTPDEILEEYNKRYSDKSINDTDDLINIEYVYIDNFDQYGDDVHGIQNNIEYNNKTVSYNNYMDNIDDEMNKKMVSDLLGCLNKKELTVIKMYYGLDGENETTMSTIATVMDLSIQRINQLYISAIKKMKNRKESLAYSK